jgi:DinB superfamily
VRIDKFNHTIDQWIAALETCHFDTLLLKPSGTGWSLGQLYTHLIEDTRFYMTQIDSCISNNDHAAAQALPMAQKLLQENAFPDILIEGAADNALIPQPTDKAILSKDLLQVKEDMNALAQKMAISPFNGKSLHPGFQYLGAEEWLQLADMHFRHHLRQKKRLDDWLVLQFRKD